MSDGSNPFVAPLARLGRSLAPSSSGSSSQERRACVLTLLRVLDNILEDPSGTNPKLRKIKVSNPAFWGRAGRWDGAIAFLEACGFVPQLSKGGGKNGVPSHLRLEGDDRDRLLSGRGELVKLAAGTLGIAENSLPTRKSKKQPKGSDSSIPSIKRASKPHPTTANENANAVARIESKEKPSPPQMDAAVPNNGARNRNEAPSMAMNANVESTAITESAATVTKSREDSLPLRGDDGVQAKPISAEMAPKDATLQVADNNLAPPQSTDAKNGVAVTRAPPPVATQSPRQRSQPPSKPKLMSLEEIQLLAKRDREDTATEAKKLKQERAESAASPREHTQSEKERAKKAARQRIIEMENERIERERKELAEQYSKRNASNVVPAKEAKVDGPMVPKDNRLDRIGTDDAKSISDEMTDLLDEIENELNDSFFDSEDGDDDGGNGSDNFTSAADAEPTPVPITVGEGDGMPQMTAREDSEELNEIKDETRVMSPAEERVRLEHNHDAEDKNNDDSAPKFDENHHGQDGIIAASECEPPMHLSEVVEELVEEPLPDDVAAPVDENDVSCQSAAAVGDESSRAEPIDESTASMADLDSVRRQSASDLLDDLETEAEMNDAANHLAPAPVMDRSQAQRSQTEDSMEHTVQEPQSSASAMSNAEPLIESSIDASPSDNSQNEDSEDEGGWPASAPLSDDDYSNLFRRIQLPEGEQLSSPDGEEAAAFRRGFELCHLSLLSIWEATALDPADHEPGSARPSSLSRCRASATAGLSNLRKWDGASLEGDEMDEPVILVPLALAYAVWAYLLGLEGSDADNNSDANRSASPGVQSGKAYSWVVSDNQGLSSLVSNITSPSLDCNGHRLPETSIAVCDYVCEALWDAGLIGIYGGKVAQGSETQPSSDPPIFIGVGRDIFEQCTQKRENNDTLGRIANRDCHNIIVQLMHPSILDELANARDFASIHRDSRVLALYFCQHAPRHLMALDRLDDAKALLSNSGFIQLRLQSLGLLNGTYAHCRDGDMMDRCLSLSVDNWRKKQLRAADLKREQSTNSLDHEDQTTTAVKSSAPDVAQWRDDHFKILCSISTILCERAGELASPEEEHYVRDESKRRGLQKDIGDAQLMIGECIGNIGVYRVEEKEHYEKALQLKSEALGGNENHESIADILYIMGCHHQRYNHYKFAQRCYEQALRIYKATLGYEHLCVARVLHNIGIMYHAKGDNSVALKCLKKSLSIRTSQLGESDISVADSHCWIGKIQREKKRFAEARECFQTAHRIKVEVLGKAHLESAEVLHNIGIVCDDLGLNSQSLSCFREALLIRLANVSGAYDINGINDVCETLDCIANVYRVKGEHKKALQFFEQCLRRRIRIASAPLLDKSQVSLLLRTYEDVIALTKLQVKEKESPSKSKDISNRIGSLYVEMATLYDHRLKKSSKALIYLQKALQVFQQKKDYNKIGSTLSMIGVIHVKKSSNAKALKCFRDSLVMRKMSTNDNDSPGIADALHNIGNCEARDGQFESSLTSYEEALQIKRKIFPPEHISIAKTEHCMGLAMLQLGNLDSALGSFERSLKVRRALLGDDHLDVSFSLHSLGRIYFHQNRVDSAIDCLEEAIQIKKSKLPEKHMSLAETQHLLGSLYIRKSEFTPAIPLLNSALIAYRGSRDCEIIKSDVLDLLGNAYAHLGETDHAILSYEHSLKIKKIVVGKDNVACANVLMEIGKLKSSKDDIDGALCSFKEVKRIHKMVYGKNHLKNADLLIQVGLIQDQLNNNDMALRCFSEALRMRRKLLGGKHRAVAEALVQTGRMHQRNEDHYKSLGFFQDAIDMYREVDGATSSEECAHACRLLGLSQMASGDNENALASLEKCIELRESTYGCESEQWAEVAYDLGIARCEAGLYDDAVVLLDKFVLLQKQSETGSPESVSNALLQLGKIYLKKRRSDSAMVCFDEALAIRKQLGDNELGVSEVLFQIGGVRQSKKQYLESLVCYEECLKLRLSVSEEDEDTADVVSRIGEVRRIRGQHDLALENFTLALAMYKRTVGETHLSVANTYHNLGYVCDAKNDLQKAMQNHKEGLSIRKLMLGGDHAKVAASLDDVAGVYQRQNELAKALKCLKEALRIRKLQLGSDDIEIGKTLFGMGIIFAATDDTEKAWECYSASLDISSRDGSSPKLEAQTLHQIGCLHAAKCDYRQALKHWRSCLSKYREAGLKDDHYMVSCTMGNIEMAENALT